MTTHPSNDAAPGGAGAHVNELISASDSTNALAPIAPPVRHDAPETSRIAAAKVTSHTGTQRARVLAMLRERGTSGATDQEIQEALGLPTNSETPRRGELVKAGLVVASGRRRMTRSNCPATVWVLPEFAPRADGGAA